MSKPLTLIKKYDLQKYISDLTCLNITERNSTLETLLPDEGIMGIEALAYAQAKFPTIDPEFLNLSHPKIQYNGDKKDEYHTLPRFAVYTFDNPECTLSYVIQIGR